MYSATSSECKQAQESNVPLSRCNNKYATIKVVYFLVILSPITTREEKRSPISSLSILTPHSQLYSCDRKKATSVDYLEITPKINGKDFSPLGKNSGSYKHTYCGSPTGTGIAVRLCALLPVFPLLPPLPLPPPLRSPLGPLPRPPLSLNTAGGGTFL